MAQALVQNQSDSQENSVSTKEFLNIEKSCELFRDSDDEIKSIFNEIKKLSGANCDTNIEGELDDDVDLILKQAEDIAQQAKSILRTSPTIDPMMDNRLVLVKSPNRPKRYCIPQINITKPENEQKASSKEKGGSKANQTANIVTKNNANEVHRKPKVRPFSASVLDSRKRAVVKSRNVYNSPKKIMSSKQEALVEELKDVNERTKSIELLNVKLTEDNKALRKKLDQIEKEKHGCDLKLVECENLIKRLRRELENRSDDFEHVKENESRLLAELNKERNDRKNLSLQRDKDVIVMQDLQRQCKEMELILKRKHPDSVSALIVASKSTTVDDNKKKLLEERIARLEEELKDKEDHFQSILLTLQEKFTDMKQKYESHIIDVERQLMDDRKINCELKTKINKPNLVDSAAQTQKSEHSVATQTLLKSTERVSSAVSRISQSSSIILNKLKEDSYLVATIKGLQNELTIKQRTIAKINRETEELRKNLRNLQREKEVLMNLNPQKKAIRQNKSAENLLMRMNTEMEAELAEAKKRSEVLSFERSSLLDSLKRTNEEFILLKKKRIQDLHTLQLAHEKELMQMNMQLMPHQEEIQMLNRTIEVLQGRLRTADDKLMRYQHHEAPAIHGGGDASSVKISAKKF